MVAKLSHLCHSERSYPPFVILSEAKNLVFNHTYKKKDSSLAQNDKGEEADIQQDSSLAQNDKGDESIYPT